MRIAVLGMGRSGRAVAEAAVRQGDRVVLFDERTIEEAADLALRDHLEGLGVEVVTGWHGRLAENAFDALVTSPGFKRTHPALRDALARGLPILSEVEYAYRLARAPIVAITGTNGKSTTTALTWTLLRAAGAEAILCGNIAGSGYPERTLTEAAADSRPGQILVAEVSSYQLEWVERFRPRVGTITNVTPDHLDRHPSFEDYLATKLRLFARMGEGDIAVLNESLTTPPMECLTAALPPGVALRTFAEVPPSGSPAPRSYPGTYLDGDELVLAGRRLPSAELRLFGHANRVNALAAWELASAALGKLSDAQAEAMIRALVEFRGLAHRMEVLGERDGVLVINNSMCTNPAALIASSRSVPRPQHLLVGGLSKNLDARPIGDYLRSSPHRAYVFGYVDPEWSEAIGEVEAECATLEEAFQLAASRARPGEAILLAPGCASAAPYANFEERGEAFRAIAGRWLAS